MPQSALRGRFFSRKEKLASFDEDKSAWVVDAGTYNFLFGASSRDIRCTAQAEAAASETAAHRVLLMQ